MPSNFKATRPETPPLKRRLRWGVWAWCSDGTYYEDWENGELNVRVRHCEVFYKRKDGGYLLRFIRPNGKWTWPYVDREVKQLFSTRRKAEIYVANIADNLMLARDAEDCEPPEPDEPDGFEWTEEQEEQDYLREINNRD